MLFRKGLIRYVDTSFNEEYLKNNLVSNVPIAEVQRMKRKVNDENEQVTFVPRQVVVLTFEGSVLPNSVKINSVNCPVEPYIQRVTQCFRCLRYGHIAKQCRSTTSLCINCGQNKDENHSCDESKTFCVFCKDSTHKTISKNCPHYQKQQNIKKHMAVSNLSYLDAKKSVDTSYSSFVTANRYEALSLTNDNNFPPLPNKTNLLNTNKYSLSQPSTSNYVTRTYSKKRKAHSPLTEPSCPPTFPFVMGPSQPLTINPHKVVSPLETKNLVDLFSKVFFNIISKIGNIEELKALNDNFIQTEIDTLINIQRNGAK